MTSLLWPGPANHEPDRHRLRQAPGAGGDRRHRRRPHDSRRAASASPTNLTTATIAAPELTSDPGTAVAVAAGGGNVALKAQALADGRSDVATARQPTHARRGLFGGSDIFGDLGQRSVKAACQVGGATHLANVPLQTVQQEYRYLHDVEARHGRPPPSTKDSGLLAGAAAGTVVDPGEGRSSAPTRQRGSRASGVQGLVERAANPNYRDPHTGQLVSFGRDVADVLGAPDR